MSDRGLYRGIYSAMLDDPDYQALSAMARHVLLTLRLCPQNNAACLFRVYPQVLAIQTGYGPTRLERAITELVEGRWVEREGWLIWIRNGLRFDPNLKLADPKHRKAVERAILAHEKSPLYLRFCDYYQITRAIQAPTKPLARPLGDPSLRGEESSIPNPKRKGKEEEERSLRGGGPDGVSHPHGSDGLNSHTTEPLAQLMARREVLRRERGYAT